MFEKLGFSVNLVIPIYSIKLQLDQESGLDENVSRLILRQPDLLKAPSFEKIESNAQKVKNPPNDPHHPKKIEKRLIILLGVFGVLITFLIIVSINTLNAPPPEIKPSPALITPAPTTITFPEQVVEVSESTDSASFE